MLEQGPDIDSVTYNKWGVFYTFNISYFPPKIDGTMVS